MQVRYAVSEAHCQAVDAARKNGVGDILSEAIENGQFLREHTLTFSFTGVSVRYGSCEAQYAWKDFTGATLIADCWIPCFQEKPIDILPCSALESFGGWKAVEEKFLDAGKDSIRHQIQTDGHTPPAKPLFAMTYTYDKQSYLRDQAESFRKRMFCRFHWGKPERLRMFFTIVLLSALIFADERPLWGLYVFSIFALNFSYLYPLTSLPRRRLERSLRQTLRFQPNQTATLYAEPKRIQVFGDISYVDVPLSNILGVRQLSNSIAIYLCDGPVLTIPAPPLSQKEDYQKLLSLLQDADL